MEKLAEELAMEIVHSEAGHYEPVHKSVSARLQSQIQKAEARGVEKGVDMLSRWGNFPVPDELRAMIAAQSPEQL